jgi:hypothetical protein
MSNVITLQQIGSQWQVCANGAVCWVGSYSEVSVLGSKLAKDLNWAYRLIPSSKQAKVESAVVWRD